MTLNFTGVKTVIYTCDKTVVLTKSNADSRIHIN